MERRWLVIEKNSKDNKMRLRIMSIYSKNDSLQFSSHKNALL